MVNMHGVEVKDRFKSQCNICSKILRTQKLLAKHMINDHGVKDTKYTKCVRKLTCPTCGHVFCRFRDRLRHEYMAHGVQHNSARVKVFFQCSVCGKKLSSNRRLKFHQLKAHGLKRKVTTVPCQFEVS